MSTSDDATVPVKVWELKALTTEAYVPKWIQMWAQSLLPKPRLVTVDLDELKACVWSPAEMERLIARLEAQA